MSGRKLSALEQKLHQAALVDPKKVRRRLQMYLGKKLISLDLDIVAKRMRDSCS